MKILFVISEFFISEPMGVMQLSAICKQHGHRTRLISLKDHVVSDVLGEFEPEVVAYSAMTSDENRFLKADIIVRAWAEKLDRKVWRIMGGPHPTYFDEILDKMELDAICIGDGDNAIVKILDAMDCGGNFSGIPNVISPDYREHHKEVVEDMDALPYLDRQLLYDASPHLQMLGLRSFQTMRGCPYKCTYCFNHTFNQMFKGDGRKLLRRRSVEHLIDEIQYVMKEFPETRFIRFSDDVFVIKSDAWLEEFAEKFPKKIGLPFYCLIRSNSLTEDVAALLSQAGCKSIGMSIEAGTPEIRNDILKRNMSDELMMRSFAIARKYGIETFTSTILAVPGTTLEDDFNSIHFTKKLNPSFPTISIFSPFPKTELTNMAIEMGLLDKEYDSNVRYRSESALNCYSEREKKMQIRLSLLAPLFCYLPEFMFPMIRVLVRLRLAPVYNIFGALIFTYMGNRKIFPGAQPRGLGPLALNAWKSIRYLVQQGETDIKDNSWERISPGITAHSSLEHRSL